MRLFVLAALLVFPLVANAQTPAPAQPADDGMVLLPRTVVQTALNWIMTPDPTVAVKLYAVLDACLNDNPHEGSTVHMGPDQCAAVTDALAARAKQLADLKKQAADAKAVPVAPNPLP